MTQLRNKVVLIGNVGKTPDIKNFENGKAKASFSMATNENYKSNKGEKVTDTQWHQVVVWGKQVDIVEKYVHKGSEIAIEGRLNHRSYEDKDGTTRYITEIVANEILLLDKKKD
jgi:single-strand DNA-binding protein